MHNLTQKDMIAAKIILRYLAGTSTLGITIQPSSNMSIKVFSDSDWAGCQATRRSTTGLYILFGKTIVSWSSKKQPTISKSSREAEYRALATTVTEVTWVQFLLRDPKIPF
ncbi:hypothetical protein LIER_38075 [Lithospermum erythrorhizon]|uniref:Mitochondrial protein n=1 Tax=Lithospermum erythrorhizon TaxID=34254 RepID=A0AAV3PUA7_LITER